MSKSCEISACLNIDLQPARCLEVDLVPRQLHSICMPGDELELFSCDINFVGYQQLGSCTLTIDSIVSVDSDTIVNTSGGAGILYSMFNIAGDLIFDWQASNAFNMSAQAGGFYVVQVMDQFGCTAFDIFEYQVILYTDYTEYTVGETPDDWVPVMHTGAFPDFEWQVDSDFRLRRGENNTAQEDGIYWNKTGLDGQIDVEIESLLSPGNTSSSGRQRLMARFAADASDSIANMLNDENTNGYLLELITGSHIRILRVVNGTVTIISANVAFSHDNLVLYRMKFQLIGDQLKGKIWLASDPEPAGWMVTATDSTFDSGFYGVSTRRIQYFHDFKLTVI